jgi:hypothetical protein
MDPSFSAARTSGSCPKSSATSRSEPQPSEPTGRHVSVWSGSLVDAAVLRPTPRRLHVRNLFRPRLRLPCGDRRSETTESIAWRLTKAESAWVDTFASPQATQADRRPASVSGLLPSADRCTSGSAGHMSGPVTSCRTKNARKRERVVEPGNMKIGVPP